MVRQAIIPQIPKPTIRKHATGITLKNPGLKKRLFAKDKAPVPMEKIVWPEAQQSNSSPQTSPASTPAPTSSLEQRLTGLHL